MLSEKSLCEQSLPKIPVLTSLMRLVWARDQCLLLCSFLLLSRLCTPKTMVLYVYILCVHIIFFIYIYINISLNPADGGELKPVGLARRPPR